MASFSKSIPYAINTETNKRIKPENATRHAAKGLYECIRSDCRRHIFLAISKHGKAHFRHYPEDDYTSTKPCHSYSQSLHTHAKELIIDMFTNGLSKRTPMPILVFETPQGIKSILPLFTSALIKNEFLIPSINRKIDVAIVDKYGEPILLIEVKHKHGIDLNKEIDLVGYWWVEVDAKDVLNNPTVLNVRRHHNFPEEFEQLGNQATLI